MKQTFVPFKLDDELESGLYWIAGTNRVYDIDAGDEGQTIGIPTDEVERFVAQGFIEVDYDELGKAVDFHVSITDQNLGGYSEDSIIDMIAKVEAPAHPFDAEEKVFSIEGSVVFLRSDSGNCVCCPEGQNHVFSHHVHWDDRSKGLELHYAKSPQDLVNKLSYKHANEGRRIRLTAELLDTASSNESATQ